MWDILQPSSRDRQYWAKYGITIFKSENYDLIICMLNIRKLASLSWVGYSTFMHALNSK